MSSEDPAGDAGNSAEKRPDPIPHLAPFRFQKGVAVPGAGRPKGLVSLRRRFRDAFAESPPNEARSLVDIVLEIARDREDPKQFEAIKFAASYGFGNPAKAQDDDVVERRALLLVAELMQEARRKVAEEPRPVLDVAEKP